MTNENRFLVEVGMQDLPYPMRTISKLVPEGQATVANISVNARIMQTFEARWIDRFVQTLHEHRGLIGTRTLKKNVLDYVRALKAATVRIDFDYPFFVEKQTPASMEKCLVCCRCAYSVKAHEVGDESRIIFKIEVDNIRVFIYSELF